MNIFEMLGKRNINPTDEFVRLAALFQIEWKVYGIKYSLKKIINGVFHKIPIQLRQTFLSVEDLLKEIGLSEEPSFGKDWNELFLYCEVLLNLMDATKIYLDKDESAKETAQQINLKYKSDSRKDKSRMGSNKRGLCHC